MAYVIAFRGGRYKNVLLGLVVVPFFTSFLIRTLAWSTCWPTTARSSPRSTASASSARSRRFGIADHGGSCRRPRAVIGGLTYNFLPFMILPIYVSLEKIDIRLTEAAKDLYNNGWQAFRKVVLPLSLPGVFAGSLLTFIPAAGDFVNAEFLGSPNNTMIGTVVQDQFLVQGDLPDRRRAVLRPHGDHHGRRRSSTPGSSAPRTSSDGRDDGPPPETAAGGPVAGH